MWQLFAVVCGRDSPHCRVSRDAGHTPSTDGRTPRHGTQEYASLARSIYLKACDELWKAHIVELQDSISNQLLASTDHKSAVALYIRRSFEAWQGFWDRVNAEFISRLLTFPVSQGYARPTPTVQVNEEVQTLIADRSMATAAGSTAGISGVTGPEQAVAASKQIPKIKRPADRLP